MRHLSHVLGRQQTERRATKQTDCTPELLRKQVQRSHQRRNSAGGQSKACKTAKRNSIGTEGDRLDNVGASTEAAVNNYLRLSTHSLDDFGQHRQRADALRRGNSQPQ